jgi:hypothetical protein
MGERHSKFYGLVIFTFPTEVVLKSKALQNMHHILLCGRLDVFVAFITRTNRMCFKMN